MGFGDFFKQTLPGLAVAVASGVPGPIGAVAQIVGKVIGKDVKATPDDITAAIAGATPDQIIELKKQDQDFQVTMQKMGFDHIEDMEKIAADDRASARNREIQVKDKTPKYLAGMVILLAAIGEGYVLRYGYPSTVSGELVGRILGTLDNALILVLSYYFGSSRGSDDKTSIIADMAKK